MRQSAGTPQVIFGPDSPPAALSANGGRWPTPGVVSILTVCVAAACLLPPLAIAAPGNLPHGENSASDATSTRQIVIAQATPNRTTEVRAPTLQGRPGEQVLLTHALVDMAASSGNYVIVNKAPAWMSLSPAESIGSGVWLIAPSQLGKARVALSQAARGEHEVSIAVVGPGGAPIAEAKLMVVTVAATSATPPAAVPTGAGNPITTLAAIATSPAAAQTVTAPAPAPKVSPTAIVAPTVVTPPVAATAPATTTATTPVAPLPAPAATTVAQNTTPPATPPKDGTKAWTEFLGGAKPGAPAKAGPGGRTPAAAQKPAATAKSETELLGYAKHLVRECTTCHSLYGQDIGIPLMVGLAKDRFLDTMELYRIGKRDNVAMASVAQSLSEEETLALAIYLGRIKPPPQAPSATRSAIGSEAATSTASAGLGFTAPAERLTGDSKDQARVDRWLKRGQQMLDQGEVSQARLLLTRAAELGDPRAALMLATSYDPNVLPWRPGMGPEAEPARAKELYQLAIRLGAGAEAERRLQELP